MIEDIKKPRWHKKEKNTDREFETSLRISIHNHKIPWAYIMKRFVIEPRADHYYSDHWLIIKDTKTNTVIKKTDNRTHMRFEDSHQAYRYIAVKRRDLWAQKEEKKKSSKKKGGSTCSLASSNT